MSIFQQALSMLAFSPFPLEGMVPAGQLIFGFLGFHDLFQLDSKLLLNFSGRTKTKLDDYLVMSFQKPLQLFFVFLGLYLALLCLPFSRETDAFISNVFRSLLIILIGAGLYHFSDSLKEMEAELTEIFHIQVDRILPFSPSFEVHHCGFSSDHGGPGMGLLHRRLYRGAGSGRLGFSWRQDTLAHTRRTGGHHGQAFFHRGLDQNSQWRERLRISIRSTKVRTFAQALVTVPNATLANEPVTNWTKWAKGGSSSAVSCMIPKTEKVYCEICAMLRNHPEIHQETIFVRTIPLENGLELFMYFYQNHQLGELAGEKIQTLNYGDTGKGRIRIAPPSRTVYGKITPGGGGSLIRPPLRKWWRAAGPVLLWSPGSEAAPDISAFQQEEILLSKEILRCKLETMWRQCSGEEEVMFMPKTAAVILAAGKGTRMHSELPKVLHRVAGKCLVQHVLDAVGEAGVVQKIVVIGHGGEQVQQLVGDSVSYAWQKEQLGTGHAVLQAMPHVAGDVERVLILCGDTPLLTGQSLKRLLRHFDETGVKGAVLTACLDRPDGYGRVVKDEEGLVLKIVEQGDAQPAELEIKEVNSGVYCFARKELEEALKILQPDNVQGEYYLTDVVSVFRRQGLPVSSCLTGEEDIYGINTRLELARAEGIFRRRINEKLMENGVTIIDPASSYIEAEVEIAPDTVIHPLTVIRENENRVQLSSGPQCGHGGQRFGRRGEGLAVGFGGGCCGERFPHRAL